MPALPCLCLQLWKVWTKYSIINEGNKAPRGLTICPKSPSPPILSDSEPVCWTQSHFALTTRKLGTHCSCQVTPSCGTYTNHFVALPWGFTSFPQTPKFNGTVHQCLPTITYSANLLESELLPPTWAIFQPFSGTTIRDKEVNISSPQPGRGPDNLAFGEFPVEAALWVTLVELGFPGTNSEGRKWFPVPCPPPDFPVLSPEPIFKVDTDSAIKKSKTWDTHYDMDDLKNILLNERS